MRITFNFQLRPHLCLRRWLSGSLRFYVTHNAECVSCVQADAAAALQQLQEAAALGDPYATFNLGYMHMRGMGTPPNATAARVNFEIAARHDMPSAYNGLGVLHYEGQAGAPVDFVAARHAFEAGAQLGDPDAMFNLATMYAGTHMDLCL